MPHLDRFNQLKANAKKYYSDTYPSLNLTLPELAAIASVSALSGIALTTDGTSDIEIFRRTELIRKSPAWKSAERKVVDSVKG